MFQYLILLNVFILHWITYYIYIIYITYTQNIQLFLNLILIQFYKNENIFIVCDFYTYSTVYTVDKID